MSTRERPMESARREATVGDLLTAVVGVPLSFLLLFWKGFLFHHIWAWFVVPLGVPALGVIGAVGILCVADWLRTSAADQWRARQIPTDELLLSLFSSFFTYGVAFLLVWLIAALAGLT